MSVDSSTGDATLLSEMVEALTKIENPVEASTGSVTDTHQETWLENLEFEKKGSGNEAPSESKSVDREFPKTAIYQPIREGSQSLPNSLVHHASILGQSFSPLGEQKRSNALRDFEENYSKMDQIPSEVVQEIVDFHKSSQRMATYAQAQKDRQIKELEKNVRYHAGYKNDLLAISLLHKDAIKGLEKKNQDLLEKNNDLESINGDLKVMIEYQKKKWEEVDKQLRARPEISFSFISPNKQTTSKPEGFETKEVPVTGLSVTPGGHKRNPSATSFTDFLPLTLSLEADIARLKVTDLLRCARDSFLEKNNNETLVLAQEIADICAKSSLGKERILVARGLFWKAQAQGQLNMWDAAQNSIMEAYSMGLGADSNCLEGDEIDTLMSEPNMKPSSIRKWLAAKTGKDQGGTPVASLSPDTKPSS